MDGNKKRPNNKDQNREIKRLGVWIGTQNNNYKKGIHIMKKSEIRKIWEETLQKYDYLCDATETWYKTHKQVCEYMDVNKKRPNNKDQNREIKRIGNWISNQITNYKKGYMKDTEIRKIWEDTLQKYDYLCDATYQWYKIHTQICEYMDVNKQRPNSNSKNSEIKKLGEWIGTQNQNYKKGLMKDQEIRKKWEETLQKYDEYFCDLIEQWHKTHKKVCEYIDVNKKRPYISDKNPEIKALGNWVNTQNTNYNKGIKIMKDQEICKKWEETLQNYNEYFCDLTEKWYKIHKQLCEYMDVNKNRPSTTDKNPEIKIIGNWIQTQNTKYKNGIMKTPKIRKIWEETLQKYDYLCDSTYQWYKTHKQACEYMDVNKKRPSQCDKDPEIKKLGSWITNQNTSYKNDLMKEPEIRKKWEETLQKYNKYFCDSIELWHKHHKNLCQYMDINKQRPNSNDKNPEIKKLGIWIGTQNQNYKKEINIMKETDIRKVWEETLQMYDYLDDPIEQWYKTHKDVCEYMDTHKKRPSGSDKNRKIKQLGQWIQKQNNNYKNGLIKDLEIHKIWDETLQKYKEYFCDSIELWHKHHKKLCQYMDVNKKKPSTIDKNPEIKILGTWIGTQNKTYKKGIEIMKDTNIRKTWEETLKKYDLCDANEQWYKNHKQLCEYMNINKKKPSTIDKNPEIKKLGKWIGTQNASYKKGIQIMKDPEIRKVWENTVQKYEYLCDANEKWLTIHKQVCEYMDVNKKRPSNEDKTLEIKQLGIWISHQHKNYKKGLMKEPEIRKVWEETLQKYDEYLCDTTENWIKTHKQACEYMDVNKKRPSKHEKNLEIKKLGSWISTQLKNYKKGTMKDPEIRKVWEETIQKYPYFQNIPKTYKDLTEEEKLKIIERHLQKKRGYQSTNPEDKDIINTVFASTMSTGKVVFLDHTEFKTAYALLERGIKPDDMVIPQRAEHYDSMTAHELFGSSVVLGEFNDVLESVLQSYKVSGIYADYCSTLEKDGIPFIELVSRYSLCEHAVIGITITLRNPEGVRFAGQDIHQMEKKLCRAFPTCENLFYKGGIVPDDGPYTYGGGAPMATWMIKL